MNSKINKILQDIDKKKKELIKEYYEMKEKYGFSIKSWRIIFNKKIKLFNKSHKRTLWQSFRIVKFRELISVPFIYFVFFPVFFLDITFFIYQQTALRLYKIPLVKRKDYIIYDRAQLDYLNFLQKFNCIYCSYVNWFLAYATEIVWRTERYWCPIKHAKKTLSPHDWEKYFSDYWDAKWFKETFCKDKKTFKR